MSRSYRKSNWRTDQQHANGGVCKFMKRRANKKVRKSIDVPDFKGYRKLYCSWNIRDYQWYETRTGKKYRSK